MNFNFFEYAAMFFSGIIAFAISYFKGKMKDLRIIIVNLLIVVSIVFFIVPFIAEYFHLSLKASCFITWVFTLFNEKLMVFLSEYIDKNTDKILKK